MFFKMASDYLWENMYSHLNEFLTGATRNLDDDVDNLEDAVEVPTDLHHLMGGILNTSFYSITEMHFVQHLSVNGSKKISRVG